MAQVSRSPSTLQNPTSPNTIHIRPPTQIEDRSVTRTMSKPPPNDISHPKQYDLETSFMITTNSLDQSSFNITSSSNKLPSHEKQPSSVENNSSLQINNDNISEESTILPILNDDGLLERKHSSILTQFPSDISSLTQPMETNVEGNIHKLRLRLIDSEFKHQHGSKNDHIKRTQKELSHSSPTPIEHHAHNVQSPSESELVYEPKIMSRHTSLSILSASTPPSLSGLSRARKGMKNDPRNYSNADRGFEIQRIHGSFDNRRQSSQQLMVSNYPYDPRLYLQPLNEEQSYMSSNMDDLIDSMARRHLANRRYNTGFDRQGRSNGFHSPYIESLTGGQVTRRSQLRNDDIIYTNRSSRNPTERDFIPTNSNSYDQIIRSRVEHYNRTQPESSDMDNDDSIRENPYIKLPPISSAHDPNRHNHPNTPTTRKETTHDSHTLPLISSEHLIKLPSDIFISSKTEPLTSLRSPRKTRGRSHSKDTRSGTDRSDGETDVSPDNRHKKNPKNGDHGFFTEPDVQQKKKTKYPRNLFKETAIGIFFIIILKRRAIKNRSHRPTQSPRAAIHKIRLQELLVALHRAYLEPDGPIYNALIQAVTHSVSLEHGLNRSSKNYLEAIRIIGNALQNIVSKIIEFMPKDGVLGTTKTSAISALIQDGNSFPENYFWQCEREHLAFDNSKLINITKQRAILLLIGIFIFRALVTTLLIKPIKYRLILGQLTPSQSASLKVLSSVMLYLGRRTARPHPQTLTLPDEWKLSLYSDADIEPIIQHSEIKSIISTCEQSLRMWSEEYIRRIDASFGKELRT